MGGGSQIRMRYCNDPVPMGAGRFCTEHLVEEQMCNMHACTYGGYAHGWQFGGSCQNARGLFDCKDGLQCVPIDLKCDCIPHCADQSDEDGEYAGCVMELSECGNDAGVTVPMMFLTVTTMVMAITAFRFMYE